MFKRGLMCAALAAGVIHGVSEGMVVGDKKRMSIEKIEKRLLNVSSTLNVRKVLSDEDLILVLNRLSTCSRIVFQEKVCLNIDRFFYPFELLFLKHKAMLYSRCLDDVHFVYPLKDIFQILPMLLTKASKRDGVALNTKFSVFDLSTVEGIQDLIRYQHGILIEEIGGFFKKVLGKQIQDSIFACLDDHYG